MFAADLGKVFTVKPAGLHLTEMGKCLELIDVVCGLSGCKGLVRYDSLNCGQLKTLISHQPLGYNPLHVTRRFYKPLSYS